MCTVLYCFLLKCRDQNSSSPVQEGANPVPRHLPFAKLENCAPSTKETSSIAPTESDECRDDSATSGVPESTAIPPSYVTYGLAPQSHGNQIAVIEKSESKACDTALYTWCHIKFICFLALWLSFDGEDVFDITIHNISECCIIKLLLLPSLVG